MLLLKTHNVLDFILGAVFLVSPWFFHFDQILEAKLLFLASGLVMIIYSLITNYGFSLTRLLPLGIHMTLDAVLGVTLILAPVLLGYRDELTKSQNVVHILLGVATVGLVALTKPGHEHVQVVNWKIESKRK